MTPFVEWTAGPYFTPFPPQFSNNPSEVGNRVTNDFGPSGGITICQGGVNPLTTVMVVQGNLINESFIASCTPLNSLGTPLPNERETEEYVPACT